MDSTRPSKNISAAPTAAPDRVVLNQQAGASGKLSMSAVGVYQQRPPTRGLLPSLLLGIIAAAVAALVFLIGRMLF
jgi:hypothetical protein